MIYPEGMSDYDFPNGTHVSSYQGWNAVGSSQSEQENCRVELDSCHYRSCMVGTILISVHFSHSWYCGRPVGLELNISGSIPAHNLYFLVKNYVVRLIKQQT